MIPPSAENHVNSASMAIPECGFQKFIRHMHEQLGYIKSSVLVGGPACSVAICPAQAWESGDGRRLKVTEH